MSMTDPIADMLTRIRNALTAGHDVAVMPASKTKEAILGVMRDEGFIRGFDSFEEGHRRYLRVLLAYQHGREPVISGLRRVSKPGLRVYTQRGEIPRVYGGLGVSIVSTSQGVVTGREAWRRRIGGEVVCYVW